MTGTKLEILRSFDLMRTSSIMQSGSESVRVSVNRSDYNGLRVKNQGENQHECKQTVVMRV